MKLKLIQMTSIHCEKLQNIVGQGSVSPYQVTISDGAVVGLTGQIRKPGESVSSNDVMVNIPPSPQLSWLRRVLRAFGLRKN